MAVTLDPAFAADFSRSLVADFLGSPATELTDLAQEAFVDFPAGTQALGQN